MLVVSKIFGVSVNTLTPDDKYSLDNWKILKQPIQIQLSKQLRVFAHFVTDFWSLNLILSISKIKVEPHSLCIFEIIDGERRAYVNA